MSDTVTKTSSSCTKYGSVALSFTGSFCHQISGIITSRDTQGFGTSYTKKTVSAQAPSPEGLQVSLPDLLLSLLWEGKAGRTLSML